MSTTATVQLAVGVQTLLLPPNQAQLVGAIAVQNQSGYDLTLSIGGAQFNVAPYTQDLYPTSPAIGTPIALLPSNNANSPANVPAYAVATWFGPDEVPEGGAYPAGLSAPPFAIGTAVALEIFTSGITIINKAPVLLYSNAGPIAGNGAQIGAMIDASKYDFVTVTFTLSNVNRDAAFTVQWDNPGTPLPIDADQITFPLDGFQLSVRLSVKGASLALFFAAATNTDTITNLAVYGDNATRPASLTVVTGQNYLAKGVQVTNGTIRIPPTAANSITVIMSNSGGAAGTNYTISTVNTDFTTTARTSGNIAAGGSATVIVSGIAGLEIVLGIVSSTSTTTYIVLEGGA